MIVNRNSLKDFRFWCIALALLALVLLFLFPRVKQSGPVYQMTFIVDITRSMNTEDYRYNGEIISRLEYVKMTLRELLTSLPCQSKVGLGVFTERRSSLLFQPIEVCSGFNELDAAIAALDWQSAWAADSRIAQGLLNTLEMLKDDKETRLIFISDGHEAPPLNTRYRPDFSIVKDKIEGLIVGVGGLEAKPIPKFDQQGKRVGFYSADDVPQRSTFGESDLNPESIQGYDARNAPFGSEAAVGSEHLSRLHEPYLKQLAAETGLGYQRLTDTAAFNQALQSATLAVNKDIWVDRQWQFASIALLALLLVFI
ncbi:vWA domain-containing protein [Methylicorpusculum sp.]|uniref:vWA domain-containing protein n=2 Tax=Methylicorpusculum sp. TaxID=2713644 RepID=UPI00273478A9|nr:vWA domain-containing protein [Methylicorpusculum sp.]MDP3528993.1 vWA domain-containing protein [Methylicorpusculum sp.]